ncbi:hypothetical protein D5282_22255 [bacterium 1xD8-48]|nr:hypothetical protein [bacterium 1xD8-48]
MEKMDELKQLFKEMLIIVQEYGGDSYNIQKVILKRILSILEGDAADTDKFSQVKCEYHKLFFPRSPLAEFCIWRDDFEERKKLNQPFSDISDRLWEILK